MPIEWNYGTDHRGSKDRDENALCCCNYAALRAGLTVNSTSCRLITKSRRALCILIALLKRGAQAYSAFSQKSRMSYLRAFPNLERVRSSEPVAESVPLGFKRPAVRSWADLGRLGLGR
jgi:hypothetical protein